MLLCRSLPWGQTEPHQCPSLSLRSGGWALTYPAGADERPMPRCGRAVMGAVRLAFFPASLARPDSLCPTVTPGRPCPLVGCLSCGAVGGSATWEDRGSSQPQRHCFIFRGRRFCLPCGRAGAASLSAPVTPALLAALLPRLAVLGHHQQQLKEAEGQWRQEAEQGGSKSRVKPQGEGSCSQAEVREGPSAGQEAGEPPTATSH